MKPQFGWSGLPVWRVPRGVWRVVRASKGHVMNQNWACFHVWGKHCSGEQVVGAGDVKIHICMHNIDGTCDMNSSEPCDMNRPASSVHHAARAIRAAQHASAW